MLSNLLCWLGRLATVRHTSIAFGLYSLNAFWLTWAGRQLDALAGGRTKLDFRLEGYQLAEVIDLFERYNLEGRTLYEQLIWIDMPFPFLVAAFSSLLFSITFRRWGWIQLGNGLILTSLLFLLTDLAENGCLLHLLTRFPAVSPDWVTACSVLTRVKLVSLLVVYTAVTGAFVGSLWQSGLRLYRYI